MAVKCGDVAGKAEGIEESRRGWLRAGKATPPPLPETGECLRRDFPFRAQHTLREKRKKRQREEELRRQAGAQERRAAEEQLS